MTEKVRRNKEIIDRFFLAVDALIDKGDIHGFVGLTDQYGLQRANMLRTRRNTNQRFDPYYLWIVVNDYNVRADWLLTGRGGMFRSGTPKVARRGPGRPKKAPS